MTAGIVITDGVAANRGAEAARLCPEHTHCATLDWPLSPADSETTVPSDVVAALSRALAACGSVAFRSDEPPEGADTFYPAGHRSAAERLRNGLRNLVGLGDAPFGLVVTTNPAAISALFAYGGWSYAAQAALVFDPAADAEPVLDALRLGLDWRRRLLPAGARLLFGPGHDGDFAVIAAANPEWLARFKAALGSAT